MSVRRIIPSVVLVAFCGVAGYLGSALARGTATAPTREPPPSPALQLPPGPLVERRLPVSPAALAAPQVAKLPEPQAGERALAKPRPTPDELMIEELQAQERDVAQGARMRQGLESAFATEPVDAEWARSAEASFRQAVTATGFNDTNGTRMSSLECRAMLCKAVFTHANDKALGEFRGSESYLDLIQPFPQSFYQRVPGEGGGPASTVLFLSREPGGVTAQLDSLPEPTE